MNDICTPDFVWAKEEDRKAFLSFNCSFWAVRKKNEKSGIFNIKDYEYENKIKTLEEELAVLQTDRNARFPRSIELEVLFIKEKEEILKAQQEFEKNTILLVSSTDDVEEFSRMSSRISDLRSSIEDLIKAKGTSSNELNSMKSVVLTKLIATSAFISEAISTIEPQ